MGNAAKRSTRSVPMVQRTAQKAYTDPDSWDLGVAKRASDLGAKLLRDESSKTNTHAQRLFAANRFDAPLIDPEEYMQEMNKTEAEVRAKSKIDPDEVNDMLRGELWQQRQYLSYRDTMLRLGVPLPSIMKKDDWVREHDMPMVQEVRDQFDLLATRNFEIDFPLAQKDDPTYHDVIATVEEGDNRLTERMFADLMELKDEDKLDFDSAGRLLNRSPEVLRRIVECIRKVPLIHVDQQNIDYETWLSCIYDGEQYEQMGLQMKGGLRGFMQASRISRGKGMGTYQLTGYFPQNIHAHQYKQPKGAARDPTRRTSGVGYGKEMIYYT